MSEVKLEDSQFIRKYCSFDSFSEIPSSWTISNFENLVVEVTDSKAKLLSSEMKEVGKFPVIDQGQDFISGYTDRQDIVRVLNSDIIIFGDHTRCLKFVNFPFVQGADGTKVLQPMLPESTKFLFYFFKSVSLPNKGYARHFKYLRQLNIPLPPIGEQKRIVEKIESTQSKIKVIEDNVTQAEALIEKYRESLLQKAFRGELVPQDPNDEPASELLKRIRAEKDKLSDGKKKKKDDLPPITEDEIPFEIPKSWEWVRAISACVEVESGSTPDAESMFEKSDIQFLKVYNLTFNGELDLSNKPTFIKQTLHQSDLARSISRSGDILVNIVGPPLGKVSQIKNTDDEFNHNQAIVHFRPDPKILNSDYLCLCLQSPIIKSHLISKAKRTSGQANLNVTTCRSMLIPLPPLEEQNRIVDRTKSILKQFANVKDFANKQLTLIAKLKESVLSSAFSGKLVPQIPSEGTGHELLAQIKSQNTEPELKEPKPTKTKKRKSK